MHNTFRLFSDLAWLWPLWGDATEEYAPYCDHVARMIHRYSRRRVATLLNIGCGGGKNVFNLKNHYRVTGLDLSPAMIAQAERLNPGCRFVEGDMRTFSLGETFDAVLMDDAISFMANRDDFSAAFRKAYDHLNPGGVLIATPDVTSETCRSGQCRRLAPSVVHRRRRPPSGGNLQGEGREKSARHHGIGDPNGELGEQPGQDEFRQRPGPLREIGRRSVVVSPPASHDREKHDDHHRQPGRKSVQGEGPAENGPPAHGNDESHGSAKRQQ